MSSFLTEDLGVAFFATGLGWVLESLHTRKISLSFTIYNQPINDFFHLVHSFFRSLCHRLERYANGRSATRHLAPFPFQRIPEHGDGMHKILTVDRLCHAPSLVDCGEETKFMLPSKETFFLQTCLKEKHSMRIYMFIIRLNSCSGLYAK